MVQLLWEMIIAVEIIACSILLFVYLVRGGGKKIGDALYASSGSRINKPITLGNNVQVCSNSVVNKSFLDDNIVLGGMPAMVKKEKVSFWYEGWEAEIWKNKVEKLRICMGL